MTLREALATLRTMGLVETRRGRGGGSFVRAPDDADRLERPLRLLSLHELRDIGDHRAAIAGAAARLGAERALPADVTMLREHAERLRGAAALTDRLGAPTRGCTSRSPRPPSRPGSPARRWTCGPRSVTWSVDSHVAVPRMVEVDVDDEKHFEYALGFAVVRRWADLSRETQQLLFDEATAGDAFEKGSRPSCMGSISRPPIGSVNRTLKC